MVNFDEIRTLLGDVLALGERAAQIAPATALMGSIPEFDSMAVVGLITAIEERWGLALDDDEISAEIFESAGSLHAFIEARLA